MASGINRAILVGNLGADPELRYTGEGKPVCTMSLATNESWVDKEGERHDRTEWHRIVVWGGQAESCGKYLHKGSRAYVEGPIRTRNWEDRDGNKRRTTEIHADEVLFLSDAGPRADSGGRRGRDEPERPAEPEAPGDEELDDAELPF